MTIRGLLCWLGILSFWIWWAAWTVYGYFTCILPSAVDV